MHPWLLGLAVVGATVLATFAGHWAFKRVKRRDFDLDDQNFAIQYAAILATLNSLLLAFMTVQVWEAHDGADGAALNEATAIERAARGLASYGGDAARHIRVELSEYGRCVVDEEWPLLAQEQSSTRCGAELDDVFLKLGGLDPRPGRQAIILEKIWDSADDVARSRVERLQASGSSVPRSLWIVVLVGTAMTVAALFVMPWRPFARAMLLLLAACHGIVFTFIVHLNQPFVGRDKVSPDALEAVLAGMARWDEHVAPAEPAAPQRRARRR